MLRSIRRAASALCPCLALALVGCSGNVIAYGVGPDGGRTVLTEGLPAIFTTNPDPNGPCFSNADFNPPDSVFIIVSNASISCSSTLPDAINDGCSSSMVWEMCFAVPASTVSAGAPPTMPGEWNGQEQDSGGCGFGSCCFNTNSYAQGPATISIDAVSASTVDFTLTGTNFVSASPVTSDGTYTATRCP